MARIDCLVVMQDWTPLQKLIQERLDVVADREHYTRDPDGHLDRLKSVSAALDALVSELPPEVDPQLRHYLERQSYLKALDWLSQTSVSSPR